MSLRVQAAGYTSRAIYQNVILSALYFYIYNEVAFYCLNNVTAVTHAGKPYLFDRCLICVIHAFDSVLVK